MGNKTKQIRVLGILLYPAITNLRFDKLTNNPYGSEQMEMKLLICEYSLKETFIV